MSHLDDKVVSQTETSVGNISPTESVAKEDSVDIPELSKMECTIITTEQTGGIHSNGSENFTVTGGIITNMDDSDTLFPLKEDSGAAVNDVKEFAAGSILKMTGSEDSATTGDVSKSTMDTKASDKTVELDMAGSDFVLDDALEVAGQVGKELKPEVPVYGEPLCSSEQNSESKIVHAGSLDSVSCKQDQPVVGTNNISLGQKNPSAVLSSSGMDKLIDSHHIEKSEGACDGDLSQVTESAREQFLKSEKSVALFDLNEAFHPKEVEKTPEVHDSPPFDLNVTLVDSEEMSAMRNVDLNEPYPFNDNVKQFEHGEGSSEYKEFSLMGFKCLTGRDGIIEIPQKMNSEGIQIPTSYSGLPSPMSTTNSTGLSTAEVKGTEQGTPRQLNFPRQTLSIEEQMRLTSQPMSEGMAMKRMEPDGGYDPYPGPGIHRRY